VLSKNPNITWDIVKENITKPWNYASLSTNPSITWEIIQANPDISWSYYWFCENPNISWDIVKANPTKDWDYIGLSCNPMEQYVFPTCIMKRKAKERTSKFKEELVMKMFHPSRVEKYIDYYGIDWEDYI